MRSWQLPGGRVRPCTGTVVHPLAEARTGVPPPGVTARPLHGSTRVDDNPLVVVARSLTQWPGTGTVVHPPILRRLQTKQSAAERGFALLRSLGGWSDERAVAAPRGAEPRAAF